MAAARLWGPVLVYLAAITALSHQPSLAPPAGAPDWLLHVIEYGGLGALAGRALVRAGRGPRGAAAAWAVAGCALFGVIDEWHQGFVPGRTADPRDVVSDTAGAAAGVGLWALAARRRGQGPIVIRLFGRAGCHLCDEAETVIRQVAAGYRVTVEKLDVDADETLRRRYGGEVPVVTIDGRKLFKIRVDPARLRRVLDSMTHDGRRSGS